MQKKVFFLLFFMVALSVPKVFAAPSVLGLSTAKLSIPPTVEGPGWLLPDSPLFFLDTVKQQIRLFFAFTPQAKAQIYANVAGERIAELRFMLIKGSSAGVETALLGIRDNTRNAASTLEKARIDKQDVAITAESINTSIKQHQALLDELLYDSSGEMQSAVAYTEKVLTDAKAVIEESLPDGLLQEEIAYDTDREIVESLSNTTSAAQQLQISLIALKSQEANAKNNSQSKREKAIEEAILQQNKLQQRLDEDAFVQKWQLGDSMAAQTTLIVQNAQKAALAYSKTKTKK